MDARSILRELFDAAVASAAPERCVPPFLPAEPKGRLLVVGAGKASAAMARALEKHWPGPLEGLVLTRYGHGAPCERIEIVEAGHPIPDARGVAATARMLSMLRGLREEDQVVALISGGGSALWAAPADGISLELKQAITSGLLRSGATIGEINCVRKHLSHVKGGRLASSAYPASVLTLAISDVPGDDPSVIASGPTVADETTTLEALAILDRHAIAIPDELRRRLVEGELETPKPGDPRLARSELRIVASPAQMLRAAARRAEELGVRALILGDAIEGEAREVGRAMAGIALSCARHDTPAEGPCVLLSGGETSVTVRGRGRGGRNKELLLGLAIALDGAAGVHALAADTDGIDGSEDDAGAFIGPDTLARARALGVDPRLHLERNDGWAFFEALGDLVITGPTRTNVNDFRAVLVR